MDMSEAQLIAALQVYMTTITVIGVVGAVLYIVANWRIFTKAGERGWKSLIPIYNLHVQYRIAWKTSYFWLSVALSLVGFMVWLFAINDGNALVAFIAFVIVIVASVIGLVFNYKMAKAFGHGLLFTIGLVLLQPIFLLILAFDGSKYIGPQ